MASFVRVLCVCVLALLSSSCVVVVQSIPTIRGLWFAWAQCDQLAAIGPLFPEESINFVMDCIPIGQWYNATFTDLRRSVGTYDLMVLDSQYIGEAVENGLVLNLNYLTSQPDVRFGDFFPNAIDAYSEYPKGSKQYWGFPFQAAAPFLVLRRDLFAAHNRSAPRDLAEMLELGQYFKSLNDPAVPYGFSTYWCGTSPAPCYDETSTIYNQFAWMEGGDLWDPATYRIDGVVNSVANARALDYTRALYLLGNPNSDISFGVQDDFCAGKSAMMLMWMGFSDYKSCPGVAAADVAYTAVPYNSATNLHVLSLGGMGLHVSANSANAALAARVAAWLTSYDGQMNWAANGGFTARKSVSLSPSFLSNPITGQANVLNGVFLAGFPLVKDFYRLPIYNTLLGVSQFWINEAILGRTTSQHALQQMAVQQQALIDVHYPCGVKLCFQPAVQVDALMTLLGFVVSLAGVWTSSMLAEDFVFLPRGTTSHAGMLLTSSGLLAFAGVWAMSVLAIGSVTFRYDDGINGARNYPTAVHAGMLAASLVVCFVLCAMALTALFVLNRTSGFWRSRSRGGKYTESASLNSVSSVSLSAEGRTDADGHSSAGQITGVAGHLRALEWTTVVGAALLTGSLQLTFFLLQRSVVSDVGVTAHAGMVVVSVLVSLSLVLLSCALLVQTRSSTLRFVACGLMAVAVLLTFVLGMEASDFRVSAVQRPVGDVEMEPLEIGVLVSATLLCLSFIGLNASRLKLSRNALSEILARVQKQAERDVAAATAVAAFESSERLRVARLFEVMSLARPLLSAATMAMALTEVNSITKDAAPANTKQGKHANEARKDNGPDANATGSKGIAPPQQTLASGPPACVRDESLLLLNLGKIESLLQSPLPSSALSRIALSDVLSHPVASELLKDHLRARHQEESLCFLQALTAYRALATPDARLQVALALSKSFVDDGAEHQVNISHDQRAHIHSQLSSRQAPADLFALVESELMQLLQLNAWASFTEVPAFKLVALVLEHPAFRLNKQHKATRAGAGATYDQYSTIGSSHTYQPADTLGGTVLDVPSRVGLRHHDSKGSSVAAGATPDRPRHRALMAVQVDEQAMVPGVSSTGTPVHQILESPVEPQQSFSVDHRH